MSYPEFVQSEADRAAHDTATAGGWSNWVRNYADLAAIRAGHTFRLDRAAYARQIIETFFFIEPGRPFKLLDFQWEIVGQIFGWTRPDGKRRFSTAYVEIPKGHGKSLLASAVSLYMLLFDGRHRAEVYLAGYDKTTTETIFKECANFIANSPLLHRYVKRVLDKSLRVDPTPKRIRVFGGGKTNRNVAVGQLRSLSKDNKNSQGLNHCHLMCFDELHVFRDREAYGSLRYATAKLEYGVDHDTPLTFTITTAGGDLTNVGYDEHQYARRFLNRELPEVPLDFYAVIYAVPEGADVFDVELVKRANPGWGTTVDPKFTLAALAKAKVSTAELLIWRRYRCNQWVVGDSQSWIPMELWRSKLPPHPLVELRGRSCVAALDLSSTDDVTALVLLFPEEDDTYHVHPIFFVPGDKAKSRQRANRLTPFLEWIKKGHLVETPGSAVDYRVIRAKVNELAAEFDLQGVALDRGWQGQQIENDLVEDGINMVPFGQGYASMSVPMKQTEVLIREGRLRHNSPVLTWMVGNVRPTMDAAGNLKPDKKAAADKIDGAVALVMAVGLASIPIAEPSVSFF